MNALLVERLRNARIHSGLRQQDVADKLGIKANTISTWENGRTEPDIDTFIKLCDIYKIDCAALLSEVYAFKNAKNDISVKEFEHIKKYRALDEHGKDVVDVVLDKEYERSTKHKFKYQLHSGQPSYSMVAEDHATYGINAAHDENPTEEQKTNADNIMDDDNEWK